MTDKLNHFDSKGNAIMVDVTEKKVTERKAIAKGKHISEFQMEI